MPLPRLSLRPSRVPRARQPGEVGRTNNKDIALRTGSDGQAVADQDLGRRGYSYELDVRRTAAADIGQPSHVTLSYRQSEPSPSAWRRIVWLDQPVHRPGETVQFSGLVRQMDNVSGTLRVPATDGTRSVPDTLRQVEVLVRDRSLGKLWQGACPLSEAGTFHGSFRLPLNANSGPCRFTVDDCSTLPNPPLVIDEFRLNTYSVRLVVPERNPAAGESVEGDVHIEYFTGKPAVGAEAEVVAELKGARAFRVNGTTDARGGFHFRLPLPPLESPEWVVLRTWRPMFRDSRSRPSTRCWFAPPLSTLRQSPTAIPLFPARSSALTIHATHWDNRPVAGATVTAFGAPRAAVTDKDGYARLPWKASEKSERVQITVVADAEMYAAHSVCRPEDSAHGVCRIHWVAHCECNIAVRRQPSDDPVQPPDRVETALKIRDWSVPSRADAGDVLHCKLKFDGAKERSATVAVFVENDRLLASRVFTLPPGEHALDIPTEKNWPPYVKLVTVVMDGETGRNGDRFRLPAPC